MIDFPLSFNFQGSECKRVLKNFLLSLVKKVSDARPARNRRAQAYLNSTSERGGQAQRSRWAFFNRLAKDSTKFHFGLRNR
jgi:hypothetical protein